MITASGGWLRRAALRSGAAARGYDAGRGCRRVGAVRWAPAGYLQRATCAARVFWCAFHKEVFVRESRSDSLRSGDSRSLTWRRSGLRAALRRGCRQEGRVPAMRAAAAVRGTRGAAAGAGGVTAVCG